MKSILFLHFLELKVLAVFEPHLPKFLQGKKGKILAKAPWRQEQLVLIMVLSTAVLRD